MSTIVFPLPLRDFDPGEAAIVWHRLSQAGHDVEFATPDGTPAACDPLMLRGAFFGFHLGGRFGAPPSVRAVYAKMLAAPSFQSPCRYEDIDLDRHLGIHFTGGHAKGMRPYVESTVLHEKAATFLRLHRPVAAVCHGTLVLARAKDSTTGRPVLEGRRVTALPANLELGAWLATFWFKGDYYRTYPVTVEKEVRDAIGPSGRFEPGPFFATYERPFHVEDGCLVTARWPGDLEGYCKALLTKIAEASETEEAATDIVPRAVDDAQGVTKNGLDHAAPPSAWNART